MTEKVLVEKKGDDTRSKKVKLEVAEDNAGAASSTENAKLEIDGDKKGAADITEDAKVEVDGYEMKEENDTESDDSFSVGLVQCKVKPTKVVPGIFKGPNDLCE